MAETTVKKSRIVSPDDSTTSPTNGTSPNKECSDDLEEALMEEFNLRLKNCMSQDDLNQQGEEQDEQNEQPEQNEAVTMQPIETKSNGDASGDFIQAEKNHHDSTSSHYDEPRKLVLNGLNQNQNGFQNDRIYENLNHNHHREDRDEEKTDPKDQETPVYEDIDDDASDHITNNCIPETLLNPCEDDPIPNPKSSPSVKDRMFLSTDATDCLLFTQTVTSPMLTPSEENIDFLKGFRRESEPKEAASAPLTSTTDLDDNVYENTKFCADEAPIYENIEHDPNKDVIENIYANLETMDEDDVPIYQNVDSSSKTEARDLEEERVESAEMSESSLVETYEQKEIEPVRPNQMVESLKFEFLKNGDKSDEDNNKLPPPKDLDLKSVDILKQISKFEQVDSQKVTSETYVETVITDSSTTGMMVMDNSNNASIKAIKKKKSKKSRKEEKENISVNGTKNANNNANNNHHEQDTYFYNVNVKSLCRSFGDLTKIDDDDENSNGYSKRSLVQIDSRTRTKSLTEVSNYHVPLTANHNKLIENVFSGVCVKSLKSSFSKFDALQKKNVLHVRSSDSSKAQEKFNGAQIDSSNCKACDKAVFQMEQIKAEKAIWHKNCFRCKECNKQLNVDTYQSHEGTLYCKPHFKALFAPKAVEDDVPNKPRKPELIIRENQPLELPPDVVRASDKPDLGLEELQNMNVKERFQVFEHHQSEQNDIERTPSAVNVKRSPSILSKLARFQARGMDIGVPDDSLNGIPIEESSSEAEDEDEEPVDGEDADLVRARKVQKEKPFHFTGMSDVKSKWEHQGEQNSKDERREERKQEIQSIRNRLFMGKQGKMKEAYQQAVMESETCVQNQRNKEKIEICENQKSIKERFEKGEVVREGDGDGDGKGGSVDDDTEVFESEISKKSRSLFLELDANASKAPQVSPPIVPKLDVKKAREAYQTKTSEEVVKSSSDQVGEIQVRTADIQQKFKFFETYKEPEREKRAFRITPPREGQVKAPTPDREVYRDPEIVRAEEYVEDSVVAKQSHTATKMLNKFRQMEENLSKEPETQGPKPLKRFTPPPEPARTEESSSEDGSGSEEEDSEDDEDTVDRSKFADEDLIEAQKAARAKQLRAKFERWEANEIKREQNNSTINMVEECGDESQIESTRSLRARFESMRAPNDVARTPRVKVNRFVEIPIESCESCNSRVYPLEKISVHGHVYHKSCFKCMECHCVLRMDSYSYNQGLLYCIPHFKRLFISKGNYDTGFGLGQHKEKWNNATLA